MAIRNLQVRETVRSLNKKIRAEADADVRDRVRIFLYAAKGLSNGEIANRLGYSLPWVQKWMARYKKGGLDGLQDAPRSGQPSFLTDEQVWLLYDEILSGPDPDAALSRYRIVDVQALIKQKFGAEFSLSGTHALMKRMKLSHVKPRPIHPKNDPEAMAAWKKKPR